LADDSPPPNTDVPIAIQFDPDVLALLPIAIDRVPPLYTPVPIAIWSLLRWSVDDVIPILIERFPMLAFPFVNIPADEPMTIALQEFELNSGPEPFPAPAPIYMLEAPRLP
jgi:hypothetical protein